MLVLSRLPREVIHVYAVPGQPPIKICLIEWTRGRARIGIDAPPGVNIVRAEVDDHRAAEKGRQP